MRVRSDFGTGLLLFSQVRVEPRAYQARTTGVSFDRLATDFSDRLGHDVAHDQDDEESAENEHDLWVRPGSG